MVRRHRGSVPPLWRDDTRGVVRQCPRWSTASAREVSSNERLAAFAHYWDFGPRACAPYRARTKGKDERGVGYVKGNAIAGHPFISWAALEAHLGWWMREIADQHVHGTSGEKPIERFARAGAAALRRLNGGGRRSGRCASWCAESKPTARSSSIPTPTVCHGG